MREKEQIGKHGKLQEPSRICRVCPGLEVPVSTLVYIPLQFHWTGGFSVQMLWFTCKIAAAHSQLHFQVPILATNKGRKQA